jgi:iron complex transport system ATP-binding protein
MAQDMAPAFVMPVYDVVLMGRYARVGRFRESASANRRIVAAALERVGLAGFQDRLFQELSTGEQQLTLIARLLVQRAPILLLDEPTANLDISHRARVFGVARDLATRGCTVIAAIHDLNEASVHCTRLILLDNGRIAATGRAEEVLTPEILGSVYGVPTVVSRSSLTGALLVEVTSNARQDNPGSNPGP